MASMDSDYEWYGDGYSEKLFSLKTTSLLAILKGQFLKIDKEAWFI